MFRTDHMGVSPSQVSCRSKSYSCSKQNTSEETPECGAQCKCTEVSEQKHHLRSETVQAKPNDAECQCAAVEPFQPSSEDVTKDSFLAHLDSPPQDASKSSLMNGNSSPKLNAEDQKLECVIEDTHSELGVVHPHGLPPKEKNSLGSEILHNDIALTAISKTLQSLPEDIAKDSLTKDLDLPREDAEKISQFNKGSCPKHSTSEHVLEFPSDSAFCEPSEEGPKPSQELIQGESLKISTVIFNCTASGHFEEPPKISSVEHLSLPPDNDINVLSAEKMVLAPLDMGKHCNLEQLETPPKDTVNSSGRVKRTPKSSRKKYMLRSLIRSDRVLRSRSQEKPKAPESSANVANVNVANINSNVGKTRRKKKKRQQKGVEADEYSRIRKHLRYLLNRMSYEQSLITAYSAEGWKGLSLEKLKPEKELQRATSEIVRRKLKIRDLFQHIDLLCAEGRLSESLFDSEGQISSEDIFCAKCGSKDLTADNDIILCDGACDRGFHQFCLVPPLLKEDIPPDDEGWLCPGCDCKVDCIDLLNDSQGTNISISDRWEKVFPEAAAAGQNPDQNLGLPSDDSDDNDYDPDGPEIDESQGDESSSDDSDFTSEELEAPPGDEQQVGLSSEDSEDDDYDPDAPDLDENVKEESSSSDFTSDSDDKLSGEVENSKSISWGDSIQEGSNCGGEKKYLHIEPVFISDLNADEETFSPISARRNAERLDYKKLYDETYGNVSSDSSDDEDYNDDEDCIDAIGPRKRRKSTGSASASENGSTPAVIKSGKQEKRDTKYAPKRSRRRSNSENTSISPNKSHEGFMQSSSSGKKVRQSVYKRLGEAATQRLYKSFKENKYPDRATKESLAKELRITFQQVTKWFENARWSFNHSSPMSASTVRRNSDRNSSAPKTNIEPLEPGHETVGRDVTSGGAQSKESPEIGVSTVGSHTEHAMKTELGNRESNIPKSKTPRLGKRKCASAHQASDLESTVVEREKVPANLPKAPERRTSQRVTRSKSVA